MRTPSVLLRLARAWKSSWVSLAVLDLVALGALALVVSGTLDGRPGELRLAPPASPVAALQEETGGGPDGELSAAIPIATRVMYVVASTDQAVQVRRLLGGVEIPTRVGSIPTPTYDILVVMTPADEEHLAKLLYAGEHPRPPMRVVDLRLE